jgi:ketosteroid isomerase-like protein
MMLTAARSDETDMLERSTLSRRAACMMLAMGSLASGAPSSAGDAAVDAAITGLFALKRRAYATGDAELLRQFYADDIMAVGEGMQPLLGIEPLIAAYKVLLPRRKGIELEILRAGKARQDDMAFQFVKFTALPVDPNEILPIVTFLFLWQRRAPGWRCVVELLLRQNLSVTPGFRVAGNTAQTAVVQGAAS